MTTRRYVCAGCARPRKGPCPRCPSTSQTTTRIAHRVVIDEIRAIEEVRTEDVPLVHGRVYLEEPYSPAFADDPGGRREIAQRIAYRLRRGWRPGVPRKDAPRRPAAWAEDLSWA